ncbi:flagellar biosynthetic protein FliR [Microbulbifer thermotolerans]|uniref:Flagellar biosynthetic protein FliR n=1 Tax=Microbulbifer thermotolerans TaxID=252514 RepID=A0A143HP18_MICTH|nr:flagellar biosynthetic protein FliR [Microbulbifer thermotolerans]AMX03180.1 flagellar biosynthetic protein FliR [Microbulbifer thermotolerans]MCX2783481.1 flagellar biosynthetic protein FliR [Microbulbifer thermotolerans]MCX2795875.1 flagellar biosynthetic protein FliR [Microbulbifer thermotolerans]MCX2835533.1 flagellar biosynthetic protein FliR [Microbulbifer thermotolerans]
MVELTYAQLHAWLVAFLWPFMRISAFLMAAPLLGHSAVPARVKVGLSALLAAAVAPGLPPMPEAPVWSWAGLGIIVEQTLIGAAMGLALRVMFSVVQAAGEYIGLQMGLAFATFLTPDGVNTVVLSRIFNTITLMMFLAVNGHLIVIDILASSFHTLPIGYTGLNPGGMELLVRYGGTIFASGLLLALPLVAALLIINLSLGILNRSAPQLTVFSVGFPTSLTLGLLLLTVLMTDFGRFLQQLFGGGLLFLQQLVETLAPL